MITSLRLLRSLLDRQAIMRIGGMFIAVLIMAFLEVAGLASILPFMQLVADQEVIHTNRYVNWVYTTGGFSSERSLLIALGLIVLSLFAVSTVFSAYTTWLIARSVWSMAHEICMQVLRTYTVVPYSFFLQHHSSDLLKKLVNDVNNIISGVLLAMANLVAYSILSLVILILLLVVETKLALLAFAVFVGAYILIHLLRHGFLERLGHRQLDASRDRFQTFAEAITGMKAIRTSGVAPFFVGRFEKASRRFCDIHPTYTIVSMFPRFVIEFITFGGILAALLFLLLRGSDVTQSLPTLSLFALASYKLLPALNKVFFAAAQLSHHLPSVQSVCRDISDVADAELITDSDKQRVPFSKAIELRNLGFSYGEDREQVLKDINLTIPRGARIGLVGSTGSGKTTLVDVIVGLLAAQDGGLYVDETLISRENVVGWRQQVAYVPQEVFLYDDTITANIAFGVPTEQVDIDRVRQAAQIAQIDGFIWNELPQQYDTEIGERGVRLSGGQRQRLGLARAFYRQPALLLLDEATSALDGITEEAVLQALGESHDSVTVIMVAHRLSTVKLCEQIYLLDAGRIAARGTHEELLRENDMFRKMVEATS